MALCNRTPGLFRVFASRVMPNARLGCRRWQQRACSALLSNQDEGHHKRSIELLQPFHTRSYRASERRRSESLSLDTPVDGKLVAIMTCTVCQTRHDYHFSKLAYTKGVVIVTCPGCSSRHLVADNLKWFCDEKKTLETMAAERGINFQRGTVDDEVAEKLHLYDNIEGRKQILGGGTANAPELEEKSQGKREKAKVHVQGNTMEITE